MFNRYTADALESWKRLDVYEELKDFVVVVVAIKVPRFVLLSNSRVMFGCMWTRCDLCRNREISRPKLKYRLSIIAERLLDISPN